MECKEKRIDMRQMSQEEVAEGQKQLKLVYNMNHAEPGSAEFNDAMQELFKDRIGTGSLVSAPTSGAAYDHITIGNNVFINSNVLLMGRGGIMIEDGVMIAANAQIISNNHDPYDLMVLICKPVLICEGAWIGAGATVLPGVRIGKHAIVGAMSVVTKDVPDYAVAVGSPARVVKELDPTRFE